MTDWTEADLEQNRKLNEIAYKLDHVVAKLEAIHDKFKPLERIIELVENIWNKVTKL